MKKHFHRFISDRIDCDYMNKLLASEQEFLTAYYAAIAEGDFKQLEQQGVTLTKAQRKSINSERYRAECANPNNRQAKQAEARKFQTKKWKKNIALEMISDLDAEAQVVALAEVYQICGIY